MKQYIPLKPVRRGFKVWMRADSCTDFVSEFQVYVGKGEVEDGLGARVMKDLTQNIKNKYHNVYCDNFFTSLFLLEDLLKDGIYGCGTIRTNRKGFPDELKAVIAAKCLKKKGEMKTVQCKPSSLKNLTVTAWKDTKVVCVAATNSTPEVTTEVKHKL